MNKAIKISTGIQLIVITGLSLLSLHSFAGQKIDQTMDVDSQSYIEIEHINGKAAVKGWDKNTILVQGELSERAEEFIFRRDGKNVLIEVKMKASNRDYNSWGNWNNDEGDDLTIYVPKTSSVFYTSVNANFNGNDLLGGLGADVVNGAINVNNVTGKIRLESVNGDIKADKVEGNVRIETVNGSIQGEHSGQGEIGFDSVNGNIRLHSDSREIDVETVNGDIELDLDQVSELDLSSVNGSIEVNMTLIENGDVEISTVGGRVELTLQQEVSARFDIEGHAGGRFINKLTDDKMQKAKYGPRRWLEFSTGNGSANVEISTVHGRIELGRR